MVLVCSCHSYLKYSWSDLKVTQSSTIHSHFRLHRTFISYTVASRNGLCSSRSAALHIATCWFHRGPTIWASPHLFEACGLQNTDMDTTCHMWTQGNVSLQKLTWKRLNDKKSDTKSAPDRCTPHGSAFPLPPWWGVSTFGTEEEHLGTFGGACTEAGSAKSAKA